MENDSGKVAGGKMDGWIKMGQDRREFIVLFYGRFFALASSTSLTHDAVRHEPMPGVKQKNPFLTNEVAGWHVQQPTPTLPLPLRNSAALLYNYFPAATFGEYLGETTS